MCTVKESACHDTAHRLCWAGLGFARWIPALTWLQLSGRSFCVDLKSFFWNTNIIAVVNFQSSMPYMYSLFTIAALQVFRETDCIPFTVFLTYKVGQRRQNASISWTESLRIHAMLILLSVFLLTDIDECAQDQHLCSQGRCENTEGSFLCICPAGFMASEEGTNCIGNNSVLSDA